MNNYLPKIINKAKVLITVKTYPLPISAFGDNVCTAGLFEGDKWIRIYPISWQRLSDEKKYAKYCWVKLNLKHSRTDKRPESYSPILGLDEDIIILGRIGTENAWAERKNFVLKEVFTSMQELIELSRSESKKSLATLKPTEIIDFIIEEETEKEWKEPWLNKRNQMNIFDLNTDGSPRKQLPNHKLPYRFKYKFISDGDKHPRILSIQDWEVGALFWKCLKRAKGDHEEAKRLVRKKYFDDFINNHDLYFFLGTHHRLQVYNARNPFFIIGIFYPPMIEQLPLFI